MLVAGTLMVVSISAQRGNPLVQFDGQGIDQMIGAFMAERQIPGVTLAIVQAPYISRVVGFGVSNTETRRLASPKTLWNVGQMARAYTAVAIMQLVEAGKLKLDDGVGRHVPGLPAAWQAVTIAQLMAHASGLPDYTAQKGFDPARKFTRAELLGLVRDAAPAFQPGAQVAASATDFLLLGQVVESASGMSYEAFVTKNQIERLQLKNTVLAKDLPAVKQETLEAAGAKHKAFLAERVFIDPTETATGYTITGPPVGMAPPVGIALPVGSAPPVGISAHQLTPVRPGTDSAWFGHGAIFASAEDISLWDIGLAGGLLVSEKRNRDVLYNPATIAGGTVPAHAGWRFPKHAGLMDIEGNVPGSSCYLARFTAPTELLCVTLCGNRDGIDFADLARRIAGAFDPKLGPGKGARTSRESTYSVAVTNDRLASFFKAKGVAAGDKVRVWQDGDGSVWVGYDDLAPALRVTIEAAVKYATAPY